MTTGAAGAVATVVPGGMTSGVGVVVVVVVDEVVVGSGRAAGRVRAKKNAICCVKRVPNTLTSPVRIVTSVWLMSLCRNISRNSIAKKPAENMNASPTCERANRISTGFMCYLKLKCTPPLCTKVSSHSRMMTPMTT